MRRTGRIGLQLLLASGSLLLLRPQTGGAGGISGTVRDSGGDPIADLWIDAYDVATNWVDSGLTDATGLYAITNLTAGAYYVRTFAISVNFVDQWFDAQVAVGSSVPAAAMPVTVGPGMTGNIDFTLYIGGVITGQVTDASSGLPMADVWVDAYEPSGARRQSVLTAADGRYELLGLAAGYYYVRTDVSGLNYVDEWYTNQPATGTGIPASAQWLLLYGGTALGPISFALDPGATVSGRVTSTVGTPLSNVWVDAYSGSGTWLLSAASDGDGFYRVYGLPAGPTYLRSFSGDSNFADEWHDNVPVQGHDVAAGATALTLVAGGAANADFSLAPGGVISGVVINVEGHPLANVGVDVYAADGTWLDGTETDLFGEYGIGHLHAGRVYLRTGVGSLNYVDEWYWGVRATGVLPPADAQTVSVSAGAVTPGIDFALRQGGIVTGLVMDASGALLAGIGVHAYDARTNWLGGAQTTASGAYAIQALPAPGAVYLVTDSGDRDYVDEWYLDTPAVGAGIPRGASPVAVATGAVVRTAHFALAAGGAVSGLVTVAGSLPFPWLTVTAYDGATNRVGEAVTGATGAYRMSGLPAGPTYLCTLDARANGYVDEWHDNVPAEGLRVPARATPVAVLSGSALAVSFSLAAGGTVEGRVTDAAGSSVSGMAVDAYDPSTNWVAGALTGTDGVYRIRGLSGPADYFVRTYGGSAGYGDEWYDNVSASEAGIPGAARRLTVASGVVTPGVDFRLDASGRIYGFVGDGAGSPIAGVWVELYGTNGGWAGTRSTDGQGWYDFGQVPAGQYLARTVSGGLGFLDEWHWNVPVRDGAVPASASRIALSAGSSVPLTFTLGYAIINWGWTNGYARLFWQAVSGTTYQVVHSLGMSDWTNAPSGTRAVDQSLRAATKQEILEYQDPDSFERRGFYRVDIVP